MQQMELTSPNNEMNYLIYIESYYFEVLQCFETFYCIEIELLLSQFSNMC